MINKVILVGRLGRDPELRHTAGGKSVANFTVATNGYGGGETTTEWHRIVCWEQKADFAAQYLRKGRLVYIEGKIQTREWSDREGAKQRTTEIVAYQIQGLDRPADAQEGAPTGGPGRAGAAPAQPPEDEDIPF